MGGAVKGKGSRDNIKYWEERKVLQWHLFLGKGLINLISSDNHCESISSSQSQMPENERKKTYSSSPETSF